jgi:membrane protein DedA with SNARE-associated domain
MYIEDLIRQYGLWAVFFGVMIEGDLTLLFTGVLAHSGYLGLYEALATATLGGFIGDSISYLIGYSGKEKIKNSHFYRRAQPQLERLCARFGVYSIFLVKYVFGLRTASAIFFGFAHMRFLRRFGPLTLLSCALWSLVLIGLGYSFSGAIYKIIGDVKRAGIVLLVALGIAAGIALALYLIERYVIARRVPEMEPTHIHLPETLSERLHGTHETGERDQDRESRPGGGTQSVMRRGSDP